MLDHERGNSTKRESTYQRVRSEQRRLHDAVPAKGEYAFSDVWGGVHKTYNDGKLARCESLNGRGLSLYAYDSDSGELAAAKHVAMAGSESYMAPQFKAEFHTAVEHKKAEVKIAGEGGFLNLGVYITELDPQQPEGQPKFEIEANYHGSEFSGSHDRNVDDELDRREKMWANPCWSIKKILFKGCECDLETGLAMAEFSFEAERRGGVLKRVQSGYRKEWVRDSEGRVKRTMKFLYGDGELYRADIVTYNPLSGDVLEQEIIMIERGVLTGFWDDQPRKWVRCFEGSGSSRRLKREERQPLTEEDLARLVAPALPLLGEYKDVLPALDILALKQEFDEMVEELKESGRRDEIKV